MPDPSKFRALLADSRRDYGHRFTDLFTFLKSTGWSVRTKGSHHIFTRPGIPILLNLQSEKNGKAKAYQVRQVRQALDRFKR